MKSLILLVTVVTATVAHRAVVDYQRVEKDTEASTKDPAGAGSQTGCSGGGQPCSGTGNCCSGYCRPDTKICNDGNGCSNGGQPCAGNPFTCCSGYCRRDTQICNYGNGCSNGGEPCAGNPGTCCSGYCRPDTQTCSYPGTRHEDGAEELPAANPDPDTIRVTSGGSKVTITIETAQTPAKRITPAKESFVESGVNLEKFSFTAEKAQGDSTLMKAGACCRCNNHAQKDFGGWGPYAMGKCVVGCIAFCIGTGGGGCSPGTC